MIHDWPPQWLNHYELRELSDLMRDLFGIRLSTYNHLRKDGFVSADLHRMIWAALLARHGMTARQGQAALGDDLYVIGPPESGMAKVGRSQDVSQRLGQLIIGSPVPLVVRHVEPGLGPAETQVHQILADRRRHGEWFDFGSDNPRQVVRDALKSLPELAWLRGLNAAVETTCGELATFGRPVTTIKALRAALDEQANAGAGPPTAQPEPLPDPGMRPQGPVLSRAPGPNSPQRTADYDQRAESARAALLAKVRRP
jgi:hypothetical protein